MTTHMHNVENAARIAFGDDRGSAARTVTPARPGRHVVAAVAVSAAIVAAVLIAGAM